ncbi:hypothetical protein BDQ12DRAFT_726180 [Crucibulum laeve]|uniref:Uncharacterized protein n=1 Tax=Crucibulum laeve TaxID=68775 RepID=A0A5C3LQY0_9AGAR|nr:hypothetical protein BDQ12DRAFT_726180 [Crucibulum laeve]
MSSVVRVDDNDPAFVYSGNWQPTQGTNEFMGTAHGARTAGDTASFTFSGTSIAVFGTIGNNPDNVIISSYTIDGNPSGSFFQPRNESTSYRQQIFRSGDLTPDTHTLVITLNSPYPWYWLDYVEYTVIASSPAVSIFLTSGLSSSTPSSTSDNISNTDSSNTVSSSNTSIRRSPAGIIAGSVTASVFIILLLLLLLWSRQRQKKNDSTLNDLDPFTGTDVIGASMLSVRIRKSNLNASAQVDIEATRSSQTAEEPGIPPPPYMIH